MNKVGKAVAAYNQLYRWILNASGINIESLDAMKLLLILDVVFAPIRDMEEYKDIDDIEHARNHIEMLEEVKLKHKEMIDGK